MAIDDLTNIITQFDLNDIWQNNLPQSWIIENLGRTFTMIEHMLGHDYKMFILEKKRFNSSDLYFNFRNL